MHHVLHTYACACPLVHMHHGIMSNVHVHTHVCSHTCMMMHIISSHLISSHMHDPCICMCLSAPPHCCPMNTHRKQPSWRHSHKSQKRFATFKVVLRSNRIFGSSLRHSSSSSFLRTRPPMKRFELEMVQHFLVLSGASPPIYSTTFSVMSRGDSVRTPTVSLHHFSLSSRMCMPLIAMNTLMPRPKWLVKRS